MIFAAFAHCMLLLKELADFIFAEIVSFMTVTPLKVKLRKSMVRWIKVDIHRLSLKDQLS